VTSRADLLSYLARLATGVVTGPTVQDIRSVAPQLTVREAGSLLRAVKAGQRVYFAGPGLQLHGAIQVYFIGGDKRTYLSRAFATRVKASAVAVPKNRIIQPRCQADGQWFGMEAAIDFAELCWGSELVWDTSQFDLIGNIMLPTGTDLLQAVTWQRVVMLLNERPDYWRSKPLVDKGPFVAQLDAAITTVAVTPAEQEELLCAYGIQDGRAWVGYCGLCGGPLVGLGCEFCLTAFARTPCYMTGLHSALPPKIEAVLPKPRPFVSDPLEARKADYAKWAVSDFIPPARPGAFGRQSRVIQL
jgi:hypothetical protein